MVDCSSLINVGRQKIMETNFPIKSEVINLEEFLKGKYKIPVYQRPYEWEEKNIDDFLSSIFDGYKEQSKPIFFGTIQLNHENNEVIDIVDGQQRLTTFLLLLKVLQELGGGGEGTAESSDSFEHVINSEELNKALNANQKEEDFSDDTSRYSINKRLLRKKILSENKEINASQCSNQGPNFYLDLKEFVLKNVYFVRLDTKEMELSDVVSVFNTINTTGLDLNASDIFKFRYYDYLKSCNDPASDMENKSWMEKIDSCYKLIDKSNEECRKDGYHSVINMSWVLDIYKHIICAQFDEWGFSEASKSNQKFFDDLFKGKNYERQEDRSILEFGSFEKLVKEFIKYWRWIEDTKYNNENNENAKELFSVSLVEKTRYSRYWTIPFVVAFFRARAHQKEWKEFYVDSLRVNLYMFRFFMIYSVVNDKVINAVQNKVCKDCFNWFKEYNIDEIITKIKKMMWSQIRWEGDVPSKEFYSIIESGLFYNGSRAHLVCTLAAFLDEIEDLGKTNNCAVSVSMSSIHERLFNWGKNPYDIEHILARNTFKDRQDNIDEYNGIGNLVVLDRSINRNIKDKSVDEKKQEYINSKYVSVRTKLCNRLEVNPKWEIKEIEKRGQEEIIKIKQFMDA